MKRRLLTFLCILALCIPILQPVSAASVCFTAVDDTLLIPLTADSMPVWSGGVLYVPYNVFSASTAGGRLGLNSIYSKNSGTVSIYILRKMMVFDLNNGTCYDQTTGESFPQKAIIRNGKAYVPANQVCNFFGLSQPTYSSTAYGYLVRFKTPSAVLSDAVFIDAAGDQMNTLLKEYTRSLQQSQESTSTQPVTPQKPQEPEPADIPTYLSFRCETGQAAQAIAQSLEQNDCSGLFFFPADRISAQGALIRRLLGCGHSVGILAEGEDTQQTLTLLEEGSRTLESVARSRTYYALVPEEQREEVEAQGWVCWNDSLSALPDGTLSAYNHAAYIARQLPKKGSVYLTLDDSQLTVEALSYLFYQLHTHGCIIAIPRETQL